MATLVKAWSCGMRAGTQPGRAGVRRRWRYVSAPSVTVGTTKGNEAGNGARQRDVTPEIKCDGHEETKVAHEESRYGTVRTGRGYAGGRIETRTQLAGA
jgi:hypothetical protein